MKQQEILQKLTSVKLLLMAHPDNELDSEFADRISDLEEIEKGLPNLISIEKAEQQLYGWSCGISNEGILDLVQAMGLSLEELNLLLSDYDISSYISDSDIKSMTKFLENE